MRYQLISYSSCRIIQLTLGINMHQPRWMLLYGDLNLPPDQTCFSQILASGYPQWGSYSVTPLTHWGRDKMAAIIQTTFSNAFSWMKMCEFRLKFHWSLFLRVQLTIFHHWFRWWLGAYQATSHYLNQWWLDLRRIYASLCLNDLRASYWMSIVS